MTMAAFDEVDEEVEDEEVDDTEDEDTEDDESSDDNDDEVGGGGEGEGETPPATPVVEGPSGRALIEALTKDPEAQSVFQTMVEEYQRNAAAEAEQREEAEAFQELIRNEDWAGVGKAVVERQQREAARSTVAEEIRRTEFTPVYTELLSQPEMQGLTDTEKDALHMSKYATTAAHLKAVTEFVAAKRFNAQVEAEVEKRVKTAREADANREGAGKAKTKSLGASPAATGPAEGRATSADYIRQGLRGIINPDAEDGDE